MRNRIVERFVLAALAACIVGVAAIPLYAHEPAPACSATCAKERMNQYLACFEKLDETRMRSSDVAQQCRQVVRDFHSWPCAEPATVNSVPLDVRITLEDGENE